MTRRLEIVWMLKLISVPLLSGSCGVVGWWLEVHRKLDQSVQEVLVGLRVRERTHL